MSYRKLHCHHDSNIVRDSVDEGQSPLTEPDFVAVKKTQVEKEENLKIVDLMYGRASEVNVICDVFTSSN